MILLSQGIIVLFFAMCLYCEISKKYRDCRLHVAIRMFLMIMSVVIFVKLPALITAPLVIQMICLIVTCVCALWLYKHVLRRQIRIKGYRIKKIYLDHMRGGRKKK